MDTKLQENTNFKKELSKNFCAAKYYYQQPQNVQMCILKKVENMTDNQLKKFIAYLGNLT